MRVLVVEDDPSIAEPLVAGLARHGFDARHVATGTEGVAGAGEVDVVLLDLGLPDLDGAEVCRRIRHTSSVPVIVVSARSEELDRVLLLEGGADDYVVKPFGLRELVARIRAVGRRSTGAPTPSARSELGPLVVDRRTREVSVDGRAVDLTPKEFDLLVHLAADPGAVCARRDILVEVWDPNWFGSPKTVDVHVASLRRKLGHPEWIAAVRGVGFRLVVPGTGGPADDGRGASGDEPR